MRILHVLDHSLPLHSGYAFRTVAILREQRALGWETLHLTSPKQGPCAAMTEIVDGWAFERTAAPPDAGLLKQMYLTARRLDQLVLKYRPDILHPHSPVLNALPAILVGRRRRVPVVYEMRASWEDAAVDHGTTTEGSLRYRLSRLLETVALRKAQQVTTICEGLRSDIVGRHVSPDRITVIPNAVDVDGFEFAVPGDPALRTALGLDGAQVLGFCGSFYGYEGLDLLLQAVASLAPELPALKVLLVGGGPQEQALQALCSELAIGDRVIFAGRVPHDQVQRYYRLIDVLVYPRKPNRLTELVTPLKPLEAMAQGKIVVASDVGGHRELIRDQDTGFLFTAGSVEALAAVLRQVLASPGCRDEMQRRGRAFVENERSWARSVARYRQVYDRAMRH